ncbi:MAG: metalloregulator ArsR/SmtB family transcription factor [Thermodesulfobacteriota bacterium]
MRQFLRVMKALSDPGRVKIIKLLEQRELCVCELFGLLDLAQSTVSKHLKILEEADLVTFRKKGQWIHYRLREVDGSLYAMAMLKQMDSWLNEEPAVTELVSELDLLEER